MENAQWLDEIRDFCEEALSRKYALIFKEVRAFPELSTLCIKLGQLHRLPEGGIPYLEGPKDLEKITDHAEQVCTEAGLELLDASTGSPYQNRGIGYLKQLGTLSIGKRDIVDIRTALPRIFWAYSTIESRLGRENKC